MKKLLILTFLLLGCSGDNNPVRQEQVIIEQSQVIEVDNYFKIFYNDWGWSGPSGTRLGSWNWERSLIKAETELPLVGGVILDIDYNILWLMIGSWYEYLDGDIMGQNPITHVNYLQEYWYKVDFETTGLDWRKGQWGLVFQTTLANPDSIQSRVQDYADALKRGELRSETDIERILLR